MANNVVYEAVKNVFPIWTFIVFSVVEILLCIYAILNWKYNSVPGKVGMCLLGGAVFLVILSIGIGYVSTKSIYEKYENGECFMVEGIIENYEVGTDEKPSYPDRFSVNGISFVISNPSYTGYGYSMRRAEGGILRNGQMCTIYYVQFKGENIIMKLLVSENTE